MTDQQRQQIIDNTMTHDAIERYKEQLHALCRRVEEAVRGDHSGEANEMIPAFKVGDRVQVVCEDFHRNGQNATVIKTAEYYQRVRFNDGHHAGIAKIWLHPAPAEQKEAAKVENPHRSPSVNAMIELIQVLRDALDDEWDKSGVTAHAINNLITARIQEANNDTH